MKTNIAPSQKPSEQKVSKKAPAEPNSIPQENGEIYHSKNSNAPDAKVKSDLDDDSVEGEGIALSKEAVDIPEVKVPNAGDPKKDLLEEFTPQAALLEMCTDMINGMNTRRVSSLYEQWRRYNRSILNQSAGNITGNELNGRCRLNWYKELYSNPIPSVLEVESYSRFTFQNFCGSTAHVLKAVQDIRAKMDMAPSQKEIVIPAVHSPQEAVAYIAKALEETLEYYKKAIEPLSEAEINTLAVENNIIFCSQFIHGHTLSNTGRAKYLVDLMNKMNRSCIYDGVETLMPILDASVLEQLAKIRPGMFETIEINGEKVQKVSTAAGDILIGGRENNRWEPDTIPNLACIIDLGGDDIYVEGVCNPSRPVLAMIDLGTGNDQYTGTKPGIQGGSNLGISLLYNEGGRNTYQARYNSQGATMGGAGILIGGSGNDTYNCFVRGQGSALCGLGLLLERSGNDDYRSALLAQGLGNPGGYGILVDIAGDDHYYVGGYYPDSYEEHPGYDGWGQGLGAGIRRVACGGIGILLDGSGDDTYEYDYFAHGGGYWMGVGIARDFSGNDKRLGATLSAYSGGRRSEARWQRFSNGFGCHYAVGYLFDDAGNDSYNGTIMGLGMGWDLGAGFLVDFDGDDSYEATGGLTQGVGAEGSIGALLDYRGNDTYYGRAQGIASGRLTYHQAYNCGSNFSFVIDHGGKDTYGSGAQNNSLSQRGTAAGFIIDRPTKQELAEEEAARLAAEKENPDQIQKIEAARPVESNVYNVSSGVNEASAFKRPNSAPQQNQRGWGAFNRRGF
ncbi:MAG: hypothetical protein Q4G69_02480 [Planctomycetia bacterium]|nr:hypothetical protein [Planctomycetia bacterium]